MTRGRIAGAPTAKAATFTVHADGCYVEATDLSGIGTEPDKIVIPAGSACRLRDNLGSGQRTTVGLGAPTSSPLVGGAIAVASSYVTVPITGSTDLTLSTVAPGRSGDLLTIGIARSSPHTAKLNVDEAGNLKLTGPCLLGSPNDTLTLLCRTADWAEIGRSING